MLWKKTHSLILGLNFIPNQRWDDINWAPICVYNTINCIHYMMIAIFNIVVWLLFLSLSGSPTQWIRRQWKGQRQTVNTSEWLSYRGLAAVVHYVHKRQKLCICVFNIYLVFSQKKTFYSIAFYFIIMTELNRWCRQIIHCTIYLLTILIETCTEIRENLNTKKQNRLPVKLTTVTERRRKGKTKEQIIRHWNVLCFIFTPIWSGDGRPSVCKL